MFIRIYRGLPCSGKSTLAKADVQTSATKAVIISTDNYFMEEGRYHFRQSELDQAHLQTFRLYLDTVHQSIADKLIIVDNTNIAAWEAAPYVQIAKAYEIPYEIVNVWASLEVILERNGRRTEKQLPLDRIISMYHKFIREELPFNWNKKTIYNT